MSMSTGCSVFQLTPAEGVKARALFEENARRARMISVIEIVVFVVGVLFSATIPFVAAFLPAWFFWGVAFPYMFFVSAIFHSKIKDEIQYSKKLIDDHALCNDLAEKDMNFVNLPEKEQGFWFKEEKEHYRADLIEEYEKLRIELIIAKADEDLIPPSVVYEDPVSMICLKVRISEMKERLKLAQTDLVLEKRELAGLCAPRTEKQKEYLVLSYKLYGVVDVKIPRGDLSLQILKMNDQLICQQLEQEYNALIGNLGLCSFAINEPDGKQTETILRAKIKKAEEKLKLAEECRRLEDSLYNLYHGVPILPEDYNLTTFLGFRGLKKHLDYLRKIKKLLDKSEIDNLKKRVLDEHEIVTLGEFLDKNHNRLMVDFMYDNQERLQFVKRVLDAFPKDSDINPYHITLAQFYNHQLTMSDEYGKLVALRSSLLAEENLDDLNLDDIKSEASELKGEIDNLQSKLLDVEEIIFLNGFLRENQEITIVDFMRDNQESLQSEESLQSVKRVLDEFLKDPDIDLEHSTLAQFYNHQLAMSDKCEKLVNLRIGLLEKLEEDLKIKANKFEEEWGKFSKKLSSCGVGLVGLLYKRAFHEYGKKPIIPLGISETNKAYAAHYFVELKKADGKLFGCFLSDRILELLVFKVIMSVASILIITLGINNAWFILGLGVATIFVLMANRFFEHVESKSEQAFHVSRLFLANFLIVKEKPPLPLRST